MTFCHLVVGMYLNAQVTMGINKLDEQGKFVTEALVVGFAQQKAFPATVTVNYQVLPSVSLSTV